MCYSVIWWPERLCAIRYSAILLNITKMAFILLNACPSPSLPQLIKITGGYNAGRQRDYGDAKQRG